VNRLRQMMRVHLSSGAGFALRFFAYLFLFCTGFWLCSLHEHLGPVQRAIASWSTLGQRWVGGHAVARGDDVVIGSMVMNINHECTGVFVYMLFMSFVLAYPVPWTARLAGLALGMPLIFAVNVMRLVTLARVVETYPHAFFYLHEYVWQGIFTVLVLVGSIAWAERFE
jgi:exosortase/archaeosortase family protein